MANPTRYEDYKDRYKNIKFDRTPEGIVTITVHSDGESLKWAGPAHDELAWAFGDVAGDAEASVVILTGVGEHFIAEFNYGTVPLAAGQLPSSDLMAHKGWSGYQLLQNMLDIQVPMIAAINGPCPIHTELPIMCDVVIASEDVWFEDTPHFPMGVVPGDGMHVIWPLVVGQNRARYFLTTDLRLTAEELKAWGAVNEIVPKADVLTRAMELARQIARKPPITRKFTRRLLTQPFRKAVTEELSHGLGLEIYAMRAFWPVGNQPMKQAWDSDAPFDEPA